MPVGFDADQDCSSVAPAAAAKGVDAIWRYLKNLSLAEAQAILAAGIDVGLIFETTGTRAVALPLAKLLANPGMRALGGAPNGTADGAQALSLANQLGAPAGIAIAATVDFDATLSQQAIVLGYLHAFRLGIPGMKLMCYANGAVCQAALDGGVADYTWTPDNSWRGSQAFIASGRATMVQQLGDTHGLNLGIAIDTDLISAADYGGWASPAKPPPLPPPPGPTPVPPPPAPPHPPGPLRRTLRLAHPFMAGPDVNEVQRLLTARHFAPGAEDGVYGPMTEAAVVAFQKARALAADGVVGPATWNLLLLRI